MRTGRIVSIFVAAAALLPCVALRAQTPAPAPAHATRIAIANPYKVFSEIAERKALRDSLESRRQRLLADEKQRRDNIEALMKQRSDTNPNHPSYREISEKIDAAKAELQSWGIATKASVERDQKWMLKSLYDKIESAIAEIAERDGIDLVMTDGREEIPNLEDMSAEELRARLNARAVLYSAKGVDISQDVITLMDKKFAQSSGAPAGGAAAPTNK